MDVVTVKVEEEYEQKPISLPVSSIQPQSPVDKVSGGDHEVFEIKVELEDDSIKQENIKQEDIKQEEELLPQITAVSGNNHNIAQDVKEEHGELTAVSGNNHDIAQDIKEEHEEPCPPPEMRLDQTKAYTDILQTAKQQRATKTASRASTSRRPPGAAAVVKQDDSYDCEFCGEKFARKPRLSKHVLAMHLDELLVKCPQCNMQFANKRALAGHQKYHTGEKLFCCKNCGEAFKYVNNYVSHMHDHMGSHPYTCDECGAGFSTKRKANIHVDTHHSRFWPYKCEECLKPFLDKKKFLRHQKKHAATSGNTAEASDSWMDTF